MGQSQSRDFGMTVGKLRIEELTEYQTRTFGEDELSEDIGKLLHASYGKQIVVQPPSFLNNRCWQLTSQGWVGYIPLTDSFHLSLIPKVPVANLFRMLEYAYRLDFTLLEGLVDSESIIELYERLALVLAKRVLDRIRKGVYRSYVPKNDNLPYVRGRIDVMAHIRNLQRVALPCNFEEHTTDLEENQILLWTLTRILESGICTERSLPHIRQARRALLGLSTLQPFSARACSDRLYNRLNQDYEPLHALCRFFLEHTGPTHRLGDRRMLPILINMDSLFELFVVEWLRKHTPARYSVLGQEKVQFHMGHIVSIRIDITVEDLETGQTAFVLDTKYKAAAKPAADDIEQVVAYAEAKGCTRAALIYPTELAYPVSGFWGRDISVRSLAFRLDGDIEESGRRLLEDLLLWAEAGEPSSR
jgi:5-methylcytosine-specific restriction enzyme subunit McrC